MTTTTPPANPAPSILSDADWRRLSPQTRTYALASFELLDIATRHLQSRDLRQASEMGWGAAAQAVKAVAENWSEYHKSHQSLVELVDYLEASGAPSSLRDGFDTAQNLHYNFYENRASAFVVTMAVERMLHFVNEVLPWLRRQPPR